MTDSRDGVRVPPDPQDVLWYARHRYFTDAEFHARVTIAVNLLNAEHRLNEKERALAAEAAAVGLAMEWVDPQAGRITDD